MAISPGPAAMLSRLIEHVQPALSPLLNQGLPPGVIITDASILHTATQPGERGGLEVFEIITISGHFRKNVFYRQHYFSQYELAALRKQTFTDAIKPILLEMCKEIRADVTKFVLETDDYRAYLAVFGSQ